MDSDEFKKRYASYMKEFEEKYNYPEKILQSLEELKGNFSKNTDPIEVLISSMTNLYGEEIKRTNKLVFFMLKKFLDVDD